MRNSTGTASPAALSTGLQALGAGVTGQLLHPSCIPTAVPLPAKTSWFLSFLIFFFYISQLLFGIIEESPGHFQHPFAPLSLAFGDSGTWQELDGRAMLFLEMSNFYPTLAGSSRLTWSEGYFCIAISPGGGGGG